MEESNINVLLADNHEATPTIVPIPQIIIIIIILYPMAPKNLLLENLI